MSTNADPLDQKDIKLKLQEIKTSGKNSPADEINESNEPDKPNKPN